MRKAHLGSVMLAILALILLGISSNFAAEPAPSSCPTGTTLCGGECTDTNIDELNCGSCGMPCALGKACINGTCSCLSGQTLCNGTCIDTSIDPANCGSCGKSCSSGLYCIDGDCRCAGAAILCDGICIDPDVDDQNCGECGRVCPYGTSCIQGGCVAYLNPWEAYH